MEQAEEKVRKFAEKEEKVETSAQMAESMVGAFDEQKPGTAVEADETARSAIGEEEQSEKARLEAGKQGKEGRLAKEEDREEVGLTAEKMVVQDQTGLATSGEEGKEGSRSAAEEEERRMNVEEEEEEEEGSVTEVETKVKTAAGPQRGAKMKRKLFKPQVCNHS